MSPRPKIPAATRRLVMERDGHACTIGLPGCTVDRYIHIDHIRPRAYGGSDHPDNLRVACRSCNLRRPNPANDARRRMAAKKRRTVEPLRRQRAITEADEIRGGP